jgi:hypothetical protein
MKAIGHEAVAEQIHAEPLLPLDHGVDERVVVRWLEEHGLPPVPAIERVVDHACDGGASGSWHPDTVAIVEA